MIALLIWFATRAGAPPFEETMVKAEIFACVDATNANVGFLRLTVPRPPGVILDAHVRAQRTYVPAQGKFLGPWRATPNAHPARLYYLGAKSCREMKKSEFLTASFAGIPCLPPKKPPYDCSRVLVPSSAAPSP